ncbi:hypothetical protein, partial [Pseudomonas aeruginosa]|uniref:hypothetical protein n=1 Tax=Pseudomonas aeruginosa TaxID=287 RepID=UPI001ABCB4D4
RAIQKPQSRFIATDFLNLTKKILTFDGFADFFFTHEQLHSHRSTTEHLNGDRGHSVFSM